MKVEKSCRCRLRLCFAWRHRADEADPEGSTILLPPSDGFALTLTEIGNGHIGHPKEVVQKVSTPREVFQ